MAKHIISGFITYEQSPYRKAPEISWQDHKPSKEYFPNKVIVAEHAIEIEIPDDFDPRGQQIAALDEQIRQTRAEFTARINELQEQKSKLLCIECAS